MNTQNSKTIQAETLSYAQVQPESPFLRISSLKPRHGAQQEVTPPNGIRVATPFVGGTEYELASVDQETAEFAELLAELQDNEFDDAVFELVGEAQELIQQEAHTHGGSSSGAAAEQFLEAHFEPLVLEAETLLESMAAAVEDQQLEAMSEPEIDRLLDPLEPTVTELSPSFENFLKKLFKKAKKAVKKVARKAARVARGAVRLAAKFSPASLVLRKLKSLARPLLQRVLKAAINRLPTRLQPLARQLARRFLRETQAESAEDVLDDVEEPATPEIGAIQEALDGHISYLVFTEDEVEQDRAIAQFVAETAQIDSAAMEALDAARVRFIREVSDLEVGQSPEAAVENFLPAVMGALRLGIKLIGRPRVVDFLAKLVAQLIGRFVGRQAAPALSRAVVDAGLKLVNLEADEEQAAGLVVAETIEEFVGRVAAFDEYVLDDQELFEEHALQAFEAAAACHFPPALLKPELRESSISQRQWISKGMYLKHADSPFRVTITPQLARRITTFGGETLEQFLRRMGQPVGQPIATSVHVYQARKGTWLSHISRDEPLPGGAARGWQLIHPLTPQAAAELLGNGALGRPVPPQFLVTRHRIAVGQRFYYLDLGAPAGTQLGRPSEVNLTLDFINSQLRVYVYFSEQDAQDIAATLRRGDPIISVLRIARGVYEAALKTVGQHVRIIRESAVYEEGEAVLSKIGEVILSWLVEKVLEWLAQQLKLYFQMRAQEFIAAQDGPADGLTMIVTFNNPTGLGVLRQAMAGRPVPLLRRLIFPPGTRIPDASVDIVTGFTRG